MIMWVYNKLTRPSRASLIAELEHIDAEMKRLPQRAARIEAEIKRIDVEAMQRSLPVRLKRGW